ncbi:DUF3072 domain-containing protein [Bradyrhizobium sp. AZCC 1578]
MSGDDPMTGAQASYLKTLCGPLEHHLVERHDKSSLRKRQR